MKKTTTEDVIFWLSQNGWNEKYELLLFSGRASGAKSKFLDKKRNKEFEIDFSQLKNCLEHTPDIIFSASKEEISSKTSFSRDEAQAWLDENTKKRYSILRWGGKAKNESLFIDHVLGREFKYSFYRIKNLLSRDGNFEFCLTKEERNKKRGETNRETCLEKYGVDNIFKVPEIKEKSKQSKIKNWGTENISSIPEIKEKVKQTVMKNWGVESSLLIPHVVEKNKEYWRKKEGVDFPLQSKKYVKNMLNQFDESIENIAQLQSIKEKVAQTKIDNGHVYLIDGKTVKEWAEQKKCAKTTLHHLLQNNTNTDKERLLEEFDLRHSSLEIKFQIFLKDNNISFIQNKQLADSKFRPDFLIEDRKLIIECDGIYWHSDQNQTDNNYHFNKKKEYLKLGYKSLFFREDEINNKFDIVASIVLNKIGATKNKVGARKCSIGLLKEDKEFFNSNHLMGNGTGRTYALFYDNQPITAMQVKWKNKQNKTLEISRFCSKLDCSVSGGFSKLINYIITIEQPKELITFIDERYGSGEYLSELKFVAAKTYPSFAWSNNNTVIHRMNFPGNSGYDSGFSKIWDAGQTKHTRWI